MKNYAAFCTLLYFTLCVSILFAQPGSLDPTFGTGGKLVTSIPFGKEFTILPDGKFLVFGHVGGFNDFEDLAVYRLHADGSPDSTFGMAGRTVIDFNDVSTGNYPTDFARAMQVLDNGGIIVTGSNIQADGFPPQKLEIALLQPDGKPNNNFGTAGRIVFDFNGFSSRKSATVEFPNGDFLLVVELDTLATSPLHHIALLRFKASGSLDTSFGPDGSGILIKPIGPAAPFSGNKINVFITPDGKILLTGTAVSAFCMNRYHSDGTDDLTFGDHGQVVINDLLGATLNTTVIQQDGKILTAGSAYFDGDPRFTLLRQQADGTLDQSFGGDGIVYSDFADFGSYGNDMSLQTDGKIVVVGWGEVISGSSWRVVRYNANGSLDAGFGVNGVVNNGFGTAYRTAINAQHAIFVSGNAVGPTGESFWALAKYNGGSYTGTEELATRYGDLHAKVSPNLIASGTPFLLTYQLPEAGSVSAQLLDVTGRVVQVFFTGESQPGGEQTRTLRCRESLPAGVYRVLLQTPKGQAIMPIVLK